MTDDKKKLVDVGTLIDTSNTVDVNSLIDDGAVKKKEPSESPLQSGGSASQTTSLNLPNIQQVIAEHPEHPLPLSPDQIQQKYSEDAENQKDISVIQKQAYDHAVAKNYAASNAVADILLTKDPANVYAHQIKGNNYLHDDKPELAEKEFTQAIAKNPKDPDLYYNRALANFRANKDLTPQNVNDANIYIKAQGGAGDGTIATAKKLSQSYAIAGNDYYANYFRKTAKDIQDAKDKQTEASNLIGFADWSQAKIGQLEDVMAAPLMIPAKMAYEGVKQIAQNIPNPLQPSITDVTEKIPNIVSGATDVAFAWLMSKPAGWVFNAALSAGELVGANDLTEWAFAPISKLLQASGIDESQLNAAQKLVVKWGNLLPFMVVMGGAKGVIDARKANDIARKLENKEPLNGEEVKDVDKVVSTATPQDAAQSANTAVQFDKIKKDAKTVSEVQQAHPDINTYRVGKDLWTKDEFLKQAQDVKNYYGEDVPVPQSAVDLFETTDPEVNKIKDELFKKEVQDADQIPKAVEVPRSEQAGATPQVAKGEGQEAQLQEPAGQGKEKEKEPKPNERLKMFQGGKENLATDIFIDPELKQEYIDAPKLGGSFKKSGEERQGVAVGEFPDALKKIGRVFEGEEVDLRGKSKQEIIDYANSLDELKLRNERKFGGKWAEVTIAEGSFGKDKQTYTGMIIGQNRGGTTIKLPEGTEKTGKSFKVIDAPKEEPPAEARGGEYGLTKEGKAFIDKENAPKKVGKTKPKKPVSETKKKKAEQKKVAQKLYDLADKFEKGGTWDDTITMSGVPFLKEHWNNAIHEAADVIRVGGEVAQMTVDAVNAALESIRGTDWYKGLDKEYQAKAEDLLSNRVKDKIKELAPKEEKGAIAPAGTSYDVRQKRAGTLGTEPPTRGKGWSKEEARLIGHDLINNGVTPESVIAEFKKDGKVNGEMFAVTEAHTEDLLKEADKVCDQYGIDSPEYDKAKQEINDWDKQTDPMRVVWQQSGEAMQGEFDVNLDTFTGMQREFTKNAGKEPNEEQTKAIKTLSDEVKKLTDKEKKSQQKIFDLLDKLKDIEDKTPKSPKAVKQAYHDLADKIRKAKIHRPGVFSAATPASLAWDLSVEAVAKTIELSGNVAQAITDGITALKDTDWYKGLGVIKQKEAEKALSDWTKENSSNKIDLQTHFADKKGSNLTLDEVRSIWNYAKKQYIDSGADNFDDMIHKVSKDIGLSPEQVRRALAQPKQIRTVTKEMYELRSRRRSAILNAQAYVKSAGDPKVTKFLKSIPNLFFLDKVFGHGTVGLITHAGMNIFTPDTWKYYMPLWLDQFKMAYGDVAKYEQKMADFKREDNYVFWKQNGLAVDPERIYDDYQGLGKYLGKKLGKIVTAGDRGFNVLKLLRYRMAEAEWNRLSDAEKADPETAKRIAREVNNATGTSDIKLPQKWSVAFFAPRLEASRWARLFVEPTKALNTLRRWKYASPAQKAAAKFTLRRSGEQLATYGSLLALNQAILSLSGSKNNINVTDPTKPDWMKFRAGDYAIDLSGGMISTLRFVGTLVYEGVVAYGGIDQKGRDKPREVDYKNIAKQIAYKLSPFLSFATEVATGESATGRPIPFSSVNATEKAPQYGWGEYLGETFTPIPIQEALGVTIDGMRQQGMTDNDILKTLKAIGVGVFTGALVGGTGMRITDLPQEPKPDEEDGSAPVIR